MGLFAFFHLTNEYFGINEKNVACYKVVHKAASVGPTRWLSRVHYVGRI